MPTADHSTAARRGGRSQAKVFGASVTRQAAPHKPADESTGGPGLRPQPTQAAVTTAARSAPGDETTLPFANCDGGRAATAEIESVWTTHVAKHVGVAVSP